MFVLTFEVIRGTAKYFPHSTPDAISNICGPEFFWGDKSHDVLTGRVTEDLCGSVEDIKQKTTICSSEAFFSDEIKDVTTPDDACAGKSFGWGFRGGAHSGITKSIHCPA
jgi:hypothetical protein